jgi:hypothetical protein
VIDEAYGLGDGGPYTKAVVTTLVAKVQAVPGEDIAVLLLGYKDDMEELMRTSNAGLSRRFRPDDAFMFEDYDDDALRAMLLSKCAAAGLEAPPGAADAAVAMLARQRQKPKFENGGAVENLLARAKESLMRRTAAAAKAGAPLEGAAGRTLLAEDMELEPPRSPEEALAGLVGARGARAKLAELRAAVAAAQARGQDPWSAVEPNLVLKGPPGCGKTTLARALGHMFHSLGLLSKPEVVEKTASALQTGYVGQAGAQVRACLDEGLGKVLLIDEVYSLSPGRGTYNDEIVTELVACLTQPKYKNKLIVVLAGYEAQVDEFMARTNPGLASRFSEHILIEAFTPDEAAQLGAARWAALAGAPLSDAGADAMLRACTRLAAQPAWASGRDVETLVKKAVRRNAMHTHGDAAGGADATGGAAAATATATARDAEDVEAAVADMLLQMSRSAATARKSKSVTGQSSPAAAMPAAAGPSRPTPPPPAAKPPSSSGVGGGGASGASGSAAALPTAFATAVAVREEEALATQAADGEEPDLWACLERECIKLGLGAADLLPDLSAGRAPECVVGAVASELGRPPQRVREMLAAQAPALLRRVRAALAAAAELEQRVAEAAEREAETRRRMWICSVCHNSNPGCPYRARQEGGYFREV